MCKSLKCIVGVIFFTTETAIYKWWLQSRVKPELFSECAPAKYFGRIG